MRAGLWMAAAVAATMTVTPVWAQTPANPPDIVDPQFAAARAELQALMQERPGEPMPDNRAALDAALAQDPGAALKLLESQKNANQVYLDLNWERARIYDGAGFAISLAYMMDNWRIAPAIPADPAKINGETPDGLRQTAVAFALYNIALVQLDGTRCADASAPSHRIDQLIQIARPILAYGWTLTADQKATIVRVAVHVERATAPVRADDPVLCSGGLDEIQRGLAAHDKPYGEAPSPPGVAGRTVEVPDAPGYKPAFLPAEAWRAKQSTLRAGLESELTTLLTAPANASGGAK